MNDDEQTFQTFSNSVLLMCMAYGGLKQSFWILGISVDMAGGMFGAAPAPGFGGNFGSGLEMVGILEATGERIPGFKSEMPTRSNK